MTAFQRAWHKPIIPRNRPPRRLGLVVDFGLEEAGEFVEVAAMFDKANDRDKCDRVDELFEFYEVQVQLALH